MKLYDGGQAPNPRRVRIFLAEKGIDDVELEPIDMLAMGHRSEAVAALNPMKRLPVLELDDGNAISETVAICRYFEALQPQPCLFGQTPLEQAQVEMWQRRMEFHLLLGIANVFRHTHPAMKEWEKPQIAEFAEANRPKVLDYLRWFDGDLGGRPYVAGDRFSIADITTTIALDFMKPARIPLPDELRNISRYYEEMKARPSYKA